MVRFVYLLPVETRERKVKPTVLLQMVRRRRDVHASVLCRCPQRQHPSRDSLRSYGNSGSPLALVFSCRGRRLLKEFYYQYIRTNSAVLINYIHTYYLFPSNSRFTIYFCMSSRCTLVRNLEIKSRPLIRNLEINVLQIKTAQSFSPMDVTIFLPWVQSTSCKTNLRSVRLAYQPPANSTFLSERISTSRQPPAKRTGR
jgi:hypothetical protein